jgi:hypothetical protein
VEIRAPFALTERRVADTGLNPSKSRLSDALKCAISLSLPSSFWRLHR